MNVIGGRVVLSPTDLVGFLACRHLATLELAAAQGDHQRPTRVDPELDLLARRGEAHEQAQLARMIGEGRSVVHVADAPETLDGLRDAEAQTLAAMRRGAGVIYQAAFFDGTWRGRADFLLRVDTPSALGAWSYEVADAKLARSVKVAALLQMCEYSVHVARLQGTAPQSMHVLLGSGATEAHRVADYAAYHRAARRRMEEAVTAQSGEDTYPEPVDHCTVCRWIDRCTAQRRRDDHLSLVAGMRRDHTRRLRESGVATVAQLAAAPPQRSADIGETPWQRLRQQARLQVHERTTGEQRYELIAPEREGLGLAALPEPSPGDLFFDMEGDPFVLDGGLEYLFGAVEIEDGAPRYHAFWAHDRAGEKAAFEALIDLVTDRLQRNPALHVYHYANYEPAALKRLMGRHATREDELDRLLRGGVLVDLYRAVAQGVRISKESYSIKKLEQFYMPRRTEAIADAAASIVAYEQWLESRQQALLDGIEAYNRRDCESTWMLRDWLERRRVELTLQGVEVRRPEPRDAEPTEQLAASAAETRERVEALTRDIPADAGERTPQQQASWLLAQLLDWHRREEKSSWWTYYARREMSGEDLVEDSEAIGGLVHRGPVRAEKKSTVHAYGFDPSQEHKLDAGDKPDDPRTGRGAGEIVAIDSDAGLLELKRGPSLDGAPHPTALMPPKPFATDAQKAALRRLADAVIAQGVDGAGRYAAVRDLLLAGTPRLRGTLPGMPLIFDTRDPVAATCRLVADLDDSYLAVQGPPGCGKTYTGAHVIVALVRAGRRVGVSATSHRAIATLLTEVSNVAGEQRRTVRILQRCDETQACGAPGVRVASRGNDEVAAALDAGEADVVAGTPWLFSDERLDGALDVLVVDEAGQMSLANACAVGTAARSLVLLGDPQQLAQPSQGVHPDGAEVSALDHVLAGHDTIPEHRGVFLPTTRRMHPDVCAFISDAFYDGRLTAHPDTLHQRVDAAPLHPTGTHILGVEHAGNRTAATEEVAAIEALLRDLDGAQWTDSRGAVHALDAQSVLVVAPYNAQVKRLRAALHGRAVAGTVDHFQGSQAPITVYSMATSSAEDMPRNLEFLFSRNRLNVAVSRAQCVAVLVCSPELLRVRCRTPQQLRLVNALCLYAESAHAVEPHRAHAVHGV